MQGGKAGPPNGIGICTGGAQREGGPFRAWESGRGDSAELKRGLLPFQQDLKGIHASPRWRTVKGSTCQGRRQDSRVPSLGREDSLEEDMREDGDPQGARGQRPATTVAQELTSTPCAARLGLALGVSAGRASASRALSSRSEQRLDKRLLVQACPAGIGCCAVRSPRPHARETLEGVPREGQTGE